MPLTCGCNINPGKPVSLETIKAHYEHTIEALLFWELIFRKGVDLTNDKAKLSQARLDFIDAVNKIFPEVG